MTGEERLIDARPANAAPDPCEACDEAATNPFTALLIAGCHQCVVRSVSNAPKLIRERWYESIPDADERLAFMRDVAREFERRHQLVERVRRSA